MLTNFVRATYKPLAALAFWLLAAQPASLAQGTTSFPLPAPGLDIAMSASGVAVVTTSGASLLWVRDENGNARNVAFTPDDCVALTLTRDGLTARMRGTVSSNMFLVDLGPDQLSVRSYSSSTTDFVLTPDERTILTGLSNNTMLVTSSATYQDFGAASLSGIPRSIVASPNSKFAFVATGASGRSIVKVRLSSRAIVDQFEASGPISKLAISPNGRQLYAIVARTLADGSTRRTLEVLDARRGTRLQSRRLSVAGSQAPSFDVETSSTSVFVSSTEPLTVGSQQAGVIRFPVRAGALLAPRALTSIGTGAGAIALDRGSKSLGVINPDSQTVTFQQVP